MHGKNTEANKTLNDSLFHTKGAVAEYSATAPFDIYTNEALLFFQTMVIGLTNQFTFYI